MPTIDPKKIEEWGRALQGAADASYFREVAIALLAEREEMLAELERLRAARVPFEGSPSWVQVEVTASDPDQRARAVESIQRGQEALSVLREVEWSARVGVNGCVSACPACLRQKPWSDEHGQSGGGHAPDCRLAKLIGG